MSNWNAMRQRITASVRTTNRMNALLSENMINKRKNLFKLAATTPEADPAAGEGGENPKRDLQFFRTNFSMERIYKFIESTVEDRLAWDRFSRAYDSWRSLKLVETLASEIRDGVKKFQHKRHRIVCIISVIEKQDQGITIKSRHLMDEKMDNFTNFVYERPTYFLVVTLFLVYKE